MSETRFFICAGVFFFIANTKRNKRQKRLREKTELKILIFIGVSNIRSYYLHCRNVRISGTQWDILRSKVINPLSGIVAMFV